MKNIAYVSVAGIIHASSAFAADAAPSSSNATAVQPAPDAAAGNRGVEGATAATAPLDERERASAVVDDTLNKANNALEEANKNLAQSNENLAKLLDDKFAFGFSIGPRLITEWDKRDRRVTSASFNPANNKLQLEINDDAVDMVASVVVVSFPWWGSSAEKNESIDQQHGSTAQKSSGWKRYIRDRLGFMINVDLAQFGSWGATTAFNKPLTGGIGLAYRLHESFGLGLTYERDVIRLPHDGVTQGAVLFEGDAASGGRPITSITIDDDRFFRDEPVSAVSFKFVYLL